MTSLALLALLTVAQAEPELPRTMSLGGVARQDPQEPFPKSEPGPEAPKETPLVDLDWLEITPAVWYSVYSSKYLADPSPAFLISLRAPLPGLSPASDPKGEYFGAFAEAAFMTIDRNLSPSVDHRKGLASFYSLGMDYSVLRDSLWIVMVRAGLLYAYYGDIAELHSGFGFMGGAMVGVQVSGHVGVSYSPELLVGKGGSLVFLNTLGVSIQF